MRKEMILNELSLREAKSLLLAREQMAQLIATLLSAIQAGSSRSLRTHAPIDAIFLAEDYPVSRWRNDPGVEREQRSFLRSLLSKSPFLSAEDSAELLDRSIGSEFLFSGRAAVGLGAALLLEALPVSMTSEPHWDSSHLTITSLSLDESGEISEDQAELLHASRPEHVYEHADWLAGRDLPISGGHDMWRRRDEIFPALVFCDAVKDQLEAIPAGEPLLRQIYKRLSELNQYFQIWDGTFDPSSIPMKISSESGITLRTYKTEHSFVCPDGSKRLFSWHGRMTPGAWRIFFEPVSDSRRAIVGYIGKKLPSVLYPT